MRLTFTLEIVIDFSLGGIGGSGGLLTTPDNVDRRASGGILPTLTAPFPEVVGSKAGSGLSVSVASPTPINARCAS